MKLSRYENVATSFEGNTLTLTVNVDETAVDVQPSASGKTLVIATTGGAKRINGLSINLTVYRAR